MTDRTAVLRELEESHEQLMRRISRIDAAHGEWAGAVGDWSVVNVLQHMTGWLDEMSDGIDRMSRGLRPTPEGADYDDADLWNANAVERAGEQSWDAARAAFDAAYARFHGAVAGFDAGRFGEGKTVNRMIEGAATGHFKEHVEDLDAYLSGDHE